MKLLIIDSHKGKDKAPDNLHIANAFQIQQHLVSKGHECDLIWSYPTVNDEIKGGYDVVAFNHSSRYSYYDKRWLLDSPNARVFYITNEYNLGEPYVLWTAAKDGLKYDVIANHEQSVSRVVRKYVNNWHQVNLNSLIVSDPVAQLPDANDCIYYGSYRAGRRYSFKHYLTEDEVIISTHSKNRKKFEALGITGPFIDRIDWKGVGLSCYKASLYIEDTITHDSYNHLANRFYEALNYSCTPLFGFECINTMARCGYDIPEDIIVVSPEDIGDYFRWGQELDLRPWQEQAKAEKADSLDKITNILTNV